jgi:hypothetical protein
VTFNSDTDIELTDTNGEQSWLYVEPKINQVNAETGAANYNALQIKVTETDIDTAGDNNLIKAGVGTSNYFKVSNRGMINTLPETITCSSDAGTASPNIRMHLIVSDGGADNNEDTVSLADGETGDEVIFTFKTDTDGGDSVNVTPAHFANGSKIVFDTPGESCHMGFDGTNWFLISHYGGTITP